MKARCSADVGCPGSGAKQLVAEDRRRWGGRNVRAGHLPGLAAAAGASGQDGHRRQGYRPIAQCHRFPFRWCQLVGLERPAATAVPTRAARGSGRNFAAAAAFRGTVGPGTASRCRVLPFVQRRTNSPPTRDTPTFCVAAPSATRTVSTIWRQPSATKCVRFWPGPWAALRSPRLRCRPSSPTCATAPARSIPSASAAEDWVFGQVRARLRELTRATRAAGDRTRARGSQAGSRPRCGPLPSGRPAAWRQASSGDRSAPPTTCARIPARRLAAWPRHGPPRSPRPCGGGGDGGRGGGELVSRRQRCWRRPGVSLVILPERADGPQVMAVPSRAPVPSIPARSPTGASAPQHTLGAAQRRRSAAAPRSRRHHGRKRHAARRPDLRRVLPCRRSRTLRRRCRRPPRAKDDAAGFRPPRSAAAVLARHGHLPPAASRRKTCRRRRCSRSSAAIRPLRCRRPSLIPGPRRTPHRRFHDRRLRPSWSPSARRAAAMTPADPAIPSPAARVFIHHTAGSDPDAAAAQALAERLRGQGSRSPLSGPCRSPSGPAAFATTSSRTAQRHAGWPPLPARSPGPADRGRRWISATTEPKPSPGTVEVWVESR